MATATRGETHDDLENETMKLNQWRNFANTAILKCICTAAVIMAASLSAHAAKTYVWPDCDTTHPCVVHHIDTVGDGTAYGETLQDFKFPMVPSSPGNLLIFTVMHVSNKSITVTDNNNGNWQTAVTTTNSSDGQESQVMYICGATAGTNLITIHLSQAAVHDEPLHFTYDEVSGVAPSACLDGTAAANGVKGTVAPGAVNTTADGDMIVNYGEETYQYPEYDNPIAPITTDSSSALLMENIVDKYANEVSVQTTHGAYTPTLHVTDPNSRNWNSVAAAFKASSGAGTQPTGIHVTRILHFVGENTNPVTVPFPSSGNAVVVSTSNDAAEWDMTSIADNEGHAYTRVPSTNAQTDPQIYSTCLGTGTGGQNLVISWKGGSINNHVMFYDIAGASAAGSSTGCVGKTVDTVIGYQGSSADAPMIGDPVITPSTSDSVIVTTSYCGTGPPSALSTPGAVFNSIWATGMIDASSWDTGDPYSYAYTTSTSPISFNYQMANANGQSNGGTNFDGAAIEILPGSGGSTSQSTLTSIAVTPKTPAIASGSTEQFTATGTYNDGSTQNITSQVGWTSSATTVASINAAGAASGLCAGSTTISASMSGESNGTTLAVTGAGATKTAVASSANPSTPNQSVKFTATVTAGCGTPTGTVQFSVDGSNYGSPVTLSNGTAAISDALASGSHTIVAVYSGSTSFAASTSSTLSQTVSSATKSNPTLTVTNSPVTYTGSAQAAQVSASVAGTVSNVRYSGSSTVPSAAGTYAITANFTPTDTTDYNSLTNASAGNFVIQNSSNNKHHHSNNSNNRR
jgi:Bacterial Ig-like domain (group 3)/Bacterial Ig-like domain (group 2)/MBG domain